jgi:prolyl-tRNA synthetase
MSASDQDLKISLFKPKAVAGSPLATIQLVVVVIEPGKDLGPASSLAKKLGFKDMRAAGDDLIMTVLSKPSKAEGLSPFSIYLSTRQDGV